MAEKGTVIRGTELFGGVPTEKKEGISLVPDLSAIRVAAWRSEDDVIVLGNITGENKSGLDVRALLDQNNR